jgi:proliferating cell nuclear antigen PCNA
MYICIENTKKIENFIALFQLLKNWSSTISIVINKKGFNIQIIDKSQICLAHICLTQEWFCTFKQETDLNTETIICLDCVALSNIMNLANKFDKIEWIFRNDPDKLNINMLNSKSNYPHFFEICLVDLELDKVIVPEVEYEVEFIIDAKKLIDLINELASFGNTFNIECLENSMSFQTSGDTGNFKIYIPVDEIEEYSIVEGEQLSLSYSLNHLSKMCLSSKFKSTIHLGISKDYPMFVSYEMEHNSKINFFLAPKLSNDF